MVRLPSTKGPDAHGGRHVTGQDRPRRVLAITGGHRVDLDAFTAMLTAICAERDWVFAHAVQPEAQRWLRPEQRGAFDVLLCHDLPGLALRRGTTPTPVGPDPDAAGQVAELLQAGQGVVFLHHALAGWPGWPGWAEVLGGRYHYAPAELRGTAWPDSGFRYASYTARVVAPEHPVCAGVSDFRLDDELYCCPIFEDDVLPLMRAVDTDPGPFRETLAEVLGTRPPGPPWQHPPASDLVAWGKSAGCSPVVYLQPGDGPQTFADETFRRLLGNALAWVSSPEAHAWAANHPTAIPPLPHPSPTG
jgi:type 1 glutamine amidotransferase